MNCVRMPAVDLRVDGENLLAPRFALALRAFVDGAAHTETVIAATALIAGKLLALRTGIERPGFGAAMLLVQHVFASDTHNFPPGAGRIVGVEMANGNWPLAVGFWPLAVSTSQLASAREPPSPFHPSPPIGNTFDAVIKAPAFESVDDLLGGTRIPKIRGPDLDRCGAGRHKLDHVFCGGNTADSDHRNLDGVRCLI